MIQCGSSMLCRHACLPRVGLILPRGVLASFALHPQRTLQEHQRYHEVLVAEENKRKALLDIVYGLEVRPRCCCCCTPSLLHAVAFHRWPLELVMAQQAAFKWWALAPCCSFRCLV